MKIVWVDTETTGLNSLKNGIIQLSAIVDIDGRSIETLDMNVRPQDGCEYDEDALRVNGKTIDEVQAHMCLHESIGMFKKMLARYISRYDKHDKAVIAGYNVRFDVEFIRQAFLFCDDKYYGSWFYSAPLDVMTLVAMYILKSNVRLKNHKLQTVCDHFEIAIDAHDSMSDIMATRNLFLRLSQELCIK